MFVLIGELRSKQEERRKTAAAAYTHLGGHCSNPESIVDLIKHLFGVLKGL